MNILRLLKSRRLLSGLPVSILVAGVLGVCWLTVHAGTWEWNVQTGKTIFNERWAEMIGYTLKELGPMCIDTWAKYCHPDDLKRSRELLEKHFRGELPYYDSELRMRHRSGEWIWVLARGKVVSRTGDGKPLLMFGSHLDITERKQAEEALKIAKEQAEAASKAKSEFLANMLDVAPTPALISRQEVLPPSRAAKSDA